MSTDDTNPAGTTEKTEFKDFCFISGKLQVEWEMLDVDQEDNEPPALLRANLRLWDGKEWKQPQDSSYCTFATVKTSRQLLEDASYALIQVVNELGHPGFDENGDARVNTKIMEAWTWTEYDTANDAIAVPRDNPYFKHYKYIREH